jgi:hypothetical protein
VLLLACSAAPALAQSEHSGHADTAAPKTAMILDGYGGGGFKVDTANPAAQAFFDNGMQLAHAFAHTASIEAMAEAVRLDPRCAMCRWGETWAAGPTINFGKDDKELAELGRKARAAAALARAKREPFAMAMTAALVARYRGGGGGKPGDLAFARAMEALVRAYPNNDTLATLAADAWMQAPSKDDAGYKANSAKAVALLEPVLARHPAFSPAIHFYIHATEEAGIGPRAEPYANRLGALAPKSQHLVHMPSHTFYWVGRYADAARVNRQAVDIGIAQAKAMDAAPPDGVFGLPYHAHNVVFGLGGALMAGDSDTALYLGRPLIAAANSDWKNARSAFLQALAGGGYVALALFAPTGEVLHSAEPKLPYLKGMWRYARGEAAARGGSAAAVRAEAAMISIPLADKDKEGWAWQASETLRIARAVLEGRAAMLDKDFAAASAAFARGATLQEQPAYGKAADPPMWWFPVRRALAEARLAAGDRAGARNEAVAALKVRPKDPGAVAILAALDGSPAAR